MKTYNYTLQYIDNMPYLIPFGQGISNHIPSILLNETSVLLWDAIHIYETIEEMVDYLIQKFQPETQDEKVELENDVKQFMNLLEQFHVFANLSFDNFDAFNSFASYTTKTIAFNIAGISMLYVGLEDLFSDKFAPFLYNESSQSHPILYAKTPQPQLTIYTAMLPSFKTVGTILVRSDDMTIYENDTEYIFIMHTYNYIKECHLSKNTMKCIIYHNTLNLDDLETAREEVFHTIRQVFLYKAQQHNMFVIHSASILYKEKAWLFSAPSGTGKSTHASLWNDLYHTPCINGDLNLLAITDTNVEVRGIPWCGTSGISDNKTYPLGGIIFLKQHPTDTIQPLTQAEKILYTMQRFISPAWTKKMVCKNLDAADFISKHTMITRLLCTKQPSSVQLIHAEIDKLTSIRS